MNIGIVSNLYPPDERGGAELVAQRVADELYARGHKVFVLTTERFTGFESFKPKLRERHLERVYRFCPINLYSLYHKIPAPFFIKMIWHLIDLWSPNAGNILKPIIIDEQPDVIITHNLKGIGLGIAKAIQTSGIPHIHTLHDLQLSIPSGLLIWGKEKAFVNISIFRKWYEDAVKRVIGKPDLVLSPSKFLADYYRSRGFFLETPVEILPNPMPKNMLPLKISRLSGPVHFLYAGQLEPHKGIVQLLKAVESLDIDFELHIAGDGSLAEMVADCALNDSRIHFHGFIPLNHLARLLVMADAVVVPSLCYENSPTVIYESFAIGVPVIASRIGGIPELIQEGENGWLVEPGDVSELARTLKNVAEQTETFCKKAETIRFRSEKYSLEHYVDQLETYLQDLVK